MDTTALLILRITYGALFLVAAAKLLSDWPAAVRQTRPTFGRLAGLVTGCGAAVMITGGLALVLGLYGRFGAALLIAFLVPGAGFHFQELRRAARQGAEAAALPEATRATILELAASARMAHFDAALKNSVLVAVGLVFLLNGTGPATLLGQ